MDLVTFNTLLLLIAFILFLIVAIAGLPHMPRFITQMGNRVNLLALGLALWGLVFLIDSWNRMT
jgi:hypothetical protein